MDLHEISQIVEAEAAKADMARDRGLAQRIRKAGELVIRHLEHPHAGLIQVRLGRVEKDGRQRLTVLVRPAGGHGKPYVVNGTRCSCPTQDGIEGQPGFGPGKLCYHFLAARLYYKHVLRYDVEILKARQAGSEAYLLPAPEREPLLPAPAADSHMTPSPTRRVRRQPQPERYRQDQVIITWADPLDPAPTGVRWDYRQSAYGAFLEGQPVGFEESPEDAMRELLRAWYERPATVED
jgi:hypothetical protein